LIHLAAGAIFLSAKEVLVVGSHVHLLVDAVGAMTLVVSIVVVKA